MFLWLHIILAVILLVLLAIDISHSGGYKSVAMMIRTVYLLMFLDGLWLFTKAWGRNPGLATVKVIFSILVIGYLEYLLMRRAKNLINKRDVIVAVCLLIILVLLGLVTAGFRPWTNL